MGIQRRPGHDHIRMARALRSGIDGDCWSFVGYDPRCLLCGGCDRYSAAPPRAISPYSPACPSDSQAHRCAPLIVLVLVWTHTAWRSRIFRWLEGYGPGDTIYSCSPDWSGCCPPCRSSLDYSRERRTVGSGPVVRLPLRRIHSCGSRFHIAVAHPSITRK